MLFNEVAYYDEYWFGFTLFGVKVNFYRRKPEYLFNGEPVDLSAATAATIADIRKAFKIQRQLERDPVTGEHLA